MLAGVVPEGSTEKAGHGPSHSELLSPPHCGEHCAKSHGRDLGLILGFVCQLRALWKSVSPLGALCLLSPVSPFYSWENGGSPP